MKYTIRKGSIAWFVVRFSGAIAFVLCLCLFSIS